MYNIEKLCVLHLVIHVITSNLYWTVFAKECPSSEKEYNKNSSICTGHDQKNHKYHCFHEEGGNITEACLQPRALLKGTCPVTKRQNGRISFVSATECHVDLSGCPDTDYLSNQLFKYPMCSVPVSRRQTYGSGEGSDKSLTTQPVPVAFTQGTAPSSEFGSNQIITLTTKDLLIAVGAVSGILFIALIICGCKNNSRSNGNVANSKSIEAGHEMDGERSLRQGHTQQKRYTDPYHEYAEIENPDDLINNSQLRQTTKATASVYVPFLRKSVSSYVLYETNKRNLPYEIPFGRGEQTFQLRITDQTNNENQQEEQERVQRNESQYDNALKRTSSI